MRKRRSKVQPRRAAAAGANRRTRGERFRSGWAGVAPVIEERLFSDALTRERKRADRFGESFVLVTVSPPAERSLDEAQWRLVTDVLSAAAREIDLVGWIKDGSVLGLIAPEIHPAGVSGTTDVESRLRRAVAPLADDPLWSDLSVRLQRYCRPLPGELVEPHGQMPGSMTPVNGTLKRGLDVLGSILLLALLSPLFLVIAALIKLSSPGPVFFRQLRVGRFGKPFTMLKFRTMVTGSDEGIHREFVSQMIKGKTPVGGDPVDAPFKLGNDPRVTRIGRILRRLSFDELPQLWNVLRGEMSLVGPRPPLPYEVEQYEPWHYRRVLEAKPGITGLWQVRGRSRTTFDEMVRLDLKYAKSYSPWIDVKILFATPRAAVLGKGAR